MGSLSLYLCMLLLCEIMFAAKKGLSFFGHDLSSKNKLRLDTAIISGNSEQTRRNLLTYPVTLTISPSELTTPNGFETIQIKWQHATMATYKDWIGIYAPINSSDLDYVDFFDTYAASNRMQEHRIWNMRDNYQCRYFTYKYTTDTYELKGVSNTATVIPHQPLQGHLSLTKKSPNEMQIRWVSSFISNPMVRIGDISQQYTKTHTATYYTYNTSKMCNNTASKIRAKYFRHPGYIYTAIVDELQANTKYFYIFGNEDYWSDEESFITQSKDRSETFGFIMYGDQGTNDAAFRHIAAIKNEMAENENIKLILHIGDLSYAWGNAYNWDKWCNMIASVAMSVPYMISIGNHEYDHFSPPNDGGNDVSGVGGDGYHPIWGNFHDDSNGECGVPTYYRFDAEICEDGNSIFWYSFDYQSVHFIMLSSEHNYSRNTDGYNFLVNDLENVDHTLMPWIIVSIHRPLYESEIYPDDNMVDAHLLQLLEGIFYKYKVDMVLAGHFHSYLRTCAVYNYSCIGHENGGIVHLTMGAAGFMLDNAEYAPNQYVLFANEIDFGYGKFFVNSTHLMVQYMGSDYGKGVIDEIVLTKNKAEIKQFSTTTTTTTTTDCIESVDCNCKSDTNHPVCCNGVQYASQCFADCQCQSECLNGKCEDTTVTTQYTDKNDAKTLLLIIICTCVIIVLLFIILVSYRWQNKKQMKAQLTFEIERDDFNEGDDFDANEENTLLNTGENLITEAFKYRDKFKIF